MELHENANELKHYGVLGMRWGRRKHNDQNRSAKNKRSAKDVKDLEIQLKRERGKRRVTTALAILGPVALAGGAYVGLIKAGEGILDDLHLMFD